MLRKSTATAFKFGIVVLLLFVLLFADGIRGISPSFFGSVAREVTAVFRDPETQWMVFLCLGVYFTTFLFLRTRTSTGFWQTANPNLWLGCVLLISAMIYAFNYSSSLDALMLLAGAVLGQGAAVWAGFEVRHRKSEVRNSLGILLLSLLVMSLASASFLNTNSSHIFEYHGYSRWSGPWDNPNIFGLLMGVGIALAAGCAGSCVMCRVSCKAEGGRWKLGVMKYAAAILCFFAAILMFRGLLHSYGRGAWLATFCGTAYLMGSRFWVLGSGGTRETSQVLNPSILNSQPSTATPNWFHRNVLPLTAIVFCVGILSFWHFRQTDWHPAHRAFSVGNQNDFSWRNRLSAWEGALQITAEHPWFGAGWNQPEPMYERYYLPPKSTESAAIQMNDYLLLGATLGIPALFFFGMYVWLCLRNGSWKMGDGEQQEAGRGQKLGIGTQDLKSDLQSPVSDLLSMTCRAGAIVLMVGFWFDGGLFKLATASIFWILLELGSTGNHEIHEPHEND